MRAPPERLTWVGAVFTTLIVGAVLLSQCVSQVRCEHAGGVYLVREWKCLKGDFREIRP